ncbi:MAG: metallophosphoesterase [Bacillus sp. (in: firmicutes)]
MGTIYSIGDIHGFYEFMLNTLSLVDLDSSKENKLIFLGDYVDRGKDSCQALYHIKELEEKYPEQVIVLLGNHEEMFIDWYTLKDEIQWLSQDLNFLTVKSFFSSEQFINIIGKMEIKRESYSEVSEYIIKEIRKLHPDLLDWLSEKKKTPLYYETDKQIYVHAGICETDPFLWKYATQPEEFTWEYPAETGSFYKDIIAGHISTVTVSADSEYLGKVFWDKQSHFFIDGEAERSGIVPLLKYDTYTGIYSSYTKEMDKSWMEYQITKRRV